MARVESEFPTELELQILKILWSDSPLTVREVRDRLKTAGRPLAHTTVITVLGTMVDKGQIEKLDPTQGKAFRYAPRLAQHHVSQGMLGALLHRVFDGSAEAVMLSLFDVADLNADELARLSQRLNSKIRETKP